MSEKQRYELEQEGNRLLTDNFKGSDSSKTTLLYIFIDTYLR